MPKKNKYVYWLRITDGFSKIDFSAAILFSVILSNFSFYSYPRLLSALSTFSIFVLGSMLFLLLSLEDPYYNTFFGLLSFSPFSSFFEILLLFFGCFVLLLNRSYYSKRGLFQYEYDLLLSFSFLGLVMLCLSNDLLVVYMAIELQSLAFYVLATFRRNSEFSNEAGLKLSHPEVGLTGQKRMHEESSSRKKQRVC